MSRSQPFTPPVFFALDLANSLRLGSVSLLTIWLLAALACANASAPRGYRFADSGSHWTGGDAPGIDDLMERYPVYFALILDPANTQDPDLRALHHDIERVPVDRFNFGALNAIAVGYFELNYRAGLQGSTYFADNFRAAKLLAVPWKAYGMTHDPGLRDAILDFFEDAGSGQKVGTAATAPRLARIVASLEAKESDPDRRTRIQHLAESLVIDPSPE
jgi:hypothetical protein